MHGTILCRFGATMLVWLAIAPAFAEEAKLPSLTYAPWTKICIGDSCFIGSDGSSNADCYPTVAAVLIEKSGDQKKTLRVTLPTWVSVERGVRIIVDQSDAIERPYLNCFVNGCMADYVAGTELVDQLRQGRVLIVEAAAKGNTPITLTVPPSGFVDAYDGPPQELKVIEEAKEEMQAEVERHSSLEEERKARWRPR